MKKAGIAMVIISTAVIVTAGFGIIKHKEYKNFTNGNIYPEDSVITVNNINIEADGMSVKDVYQKYLDEFSGNSQVILHIGNNDYKMDISDNIKHSVTEHDFAECIKNKTFTDYLFKKHNKYKLNDKYEYSGNSSEALEDILKNNDYGFEPVKDAYLDKEKIEIVPEKNGTELDLDKAKEYLETELKNGTREIDFQKEELYKKPQVTEEDVREKFKDILEVINWKAQYSVSDYVIKLSDYKSYIHINDDGTYEIDNSFLKDAVLGLSKTIDKTYESIKFQSAKDGEITVRGGTYGQIMSNSKEISYLQEKLAAGESVSDRKPEWICKPLPEGGLPEEYVEVDLSRQHVWHYKNGKLCCETDCVTGDAGKGHNTPEGAYYVSEMIPGKYLIGTGYKTWVNRWMRLTNTGIGLHDAGWRSSFGRNIYKTNGSHGCVNLPSSFAYNLYSEISTGTLVVIHN